MESQFQTALALHKAGRLAEAEALYRQVLDWRPDWTCGNLGALLRITGRLDEAEAMLRRGLSVAPDNLPNRHTLGMTLLQLGRWREAWPFYEARRELYPHPHPQLPEWQGEPLAGRQLIVVAEQGLGDMILLSRFLPLVAEQAGQVTAAVPRALLRLLETPTVRTAYPADWASIEGDLWTFMGSVPRWLGAGPQDVPLPAPHPGGQGLGLMVEGGDRNPNPRRIPPRAAFEALRDLGPFEDLRPQASGAADLAATAEIIRGLEGVVTVDTSVAHLAGLLGKPAFVILPRPAIDWYTRWEDDRSPWYPTMRTFRQTEAEAGDWDGVMQRLAAAVQASKSRPMSP